MKKSLNLFGEWQEIKPLRKAKIKVILNDYDSKYFLSTAQALIWAEYKSGYKGGSLYPSERGQEDY